MSYTRYYASGWLEGETGNTPITPDALNYMESGITSAHTVAEAAKTAADNALPKNGGTLTGPLILTPGVHYGNSLPSAGQAGRIFFKKV